MPFVSILGTTKHDEIQERKQPDFFVDLNLDQVINRVQKNSPDYAVKEYFYIFPSKEDVRYRQEIYRDIRKPALYDRLMQFSADMRRSADKEVSPAFSGEPLQGACWQLESVYFYCKAIIELKQELEMGIAKQEVTADGLQELCGFLEDICKEPAFAQMQKDAYEIWEMLTGTRFTVEIIGNKLRISPKAQDGTYEDLLAECFGEYGVVEKGSMHSPFTTDLFLTRLERRMLETFFHKYPKLEAEITRFGEKYQQYKDPRILQLEQEVQFYLAFYAFQKEWEGRGAVFATPTFDETKAMEGVEVYDLALACVNFPAEKEVVSNDFLYTAKEQFFIVNGPNQGGKTTFARSLGQLIYFAKMGLDVNAKKANLYYFDRLVTHFSVEESMESGQGKLMEELRRLAPIMNKGCEKAFVIINELFTTAAHYDGCIMGARVLDYFMKRNCHGVYVTHLRALGADTDGVVHMAAMLDGSAEHRRTFKIMRSNAEHKGHAGDIVGKYKLTYGELQERLKEYTAKKGGGSHA